jgi:UDP-N-acetylmuramoyl-tripeptide--D-alanyl-D-alanine ligase
LITLEEILKIKYKDKLKIDKILLRKFDGISIDSRNIGKNELFVAIKGESTDGHNYIKDVFAKGVKLAIVEKNWFIKNKNIFKNNSFLIVENSVKALGELAGIYRHKFYIPLLAVSGSNGKTTTKDLLAAVLSKKYMVLNTEANFNNHIGVPITLFRLDSSYDFIVLEIGSNHFGELQYLCSFAEPDFGLVTNIGREHLEFFKNVQGAAKEELTLFDYLRESGNKPCFLNYDDTYVRNYARKFKLNNSFSYSYKYDTDVNGKFLGFNKNFNPRINVSGVNFDFDFTVSTFGMHSVYNGLAAACAGIYFGVSNTKIQNALSNFKEQSQNRMNVTEFNNVKIINDAYNSNPDSVKLGLETMKMYRTKGKIHLVLSDMLEMGKNGRRLHFEVGELAKKMKFENIYTYGENAFQIFKGAKGIQNNFYFKDKIDLSEFLKVIVKPDDAVYIKGSRGMKMEDVVNYLNNTK